MSLMGISDWRAKKQMKYPVRGILRITGADDAQAVSANTRFSGVISAPGVPDTTVHHQTDQGDRLAGVQELPVLVDRADPRRFTILWDELQAGTWRDPQGQVTQEGFNVTTTVVTTGPDGQPLPPEAAARVESALGRVFGQGGGQMFGRVISQAMGEALGEGVERSIRRAAEDALGPFGGTALGRRAGRAFGGAVGGAVGQAGEVVFGRGGNQPYGLGGNQPYAPPDQGQPGLGQSGQGQSGLGQPGQPFNQPAQPPQPPQAPPGGAPFGQQGSAFPQVSWDHSQAPAAGQEPVAGPASPGDQSFAGPPAAGGPPFGAGSASAGGRPDPGEAAQFFASGAGEHASAVVTAVQDVPPEPGFAPPGGTADLMLEITRADGSVYHAPTRLSFATQERRAAIAAPGTQLRVWVDPNLPTRVAIVS